MVDIPGNSSTGATIAVGGTVTSTLETMGDHDWFRITLEAGQSISISLSGAGGTPLEDPYLYLRSASGLLIKEDDDGGSGRNARITFTATSSGTYYIDAGAWNEGYTGGYQLSVSAWTPGVLPVGTNDQIADQLVSGYWNGDSHRFNVRQGGTITVDLTGLTTEGRFLAREALGLWSDVIGVRFSEVSTGAQITFDDNEEGAHAQGVWSGGIISSASINVSTGWLSSYGSVLNSYSFQTYVHEIGHALGLGHAGDYNGDATYSTDALYANDAWSTSVMSYFDQQDNSYFAERGFTKNLALTPMVADIVAMGRLYGLSTSTRLGDTTYGFNSTANRSVFDATRNGAATNPFAYTIFDSGGTDTLDYSGYSAAQLIDLNSETFSNVGGDTGNVSIARGTLIENAIGGSGADSLIGNAAANLLTGNAGDDSLNGGAGADRMQGGAGNDTYHVDQGGDVVVEASGAGTDTINAAADFALSANVENLTLTGGAVRATGNALANVIVGNAGANLLYGVAGDDTLRGQDGDDRLEGGAGADSLHGGAGNDRYVIADTLDTASENTGEGTDTVYASVTLALGANLEILRLTGTGNIAGTGNALANLIYGNSGANQLFGLAGDDRFYGQGGDDRIEGGAGVDRMYGGAGNDTYIVTDSTDYAYELAGEGTDSVHSSVTHVLRANLEQLYLTGTGDIRGYGNELANVLTGNAGANVLGSGAGNDRLFGESGADVLSGGDGSDLLDGGAGRDRFKGGADADTFVFNDGDFAGTGSLADQIHDFGDAEGDRISLVAVDANSALEGDQAFTLIGTGAFTGAAGQLRYEHRSGHTYIQGDTNGDGAADFWIRLDGVHVLATDDFIF